MNSRKYITPPGAGRAARVAEELRSTETELDEFTMARMERAMIHQWSARAARVAPLSRSRPRPVRVLMFASALVGAMLFGTVLGLFVLADEAPPLVPEGGAQFETRLANGVVQRGPLSEGQTLESGHGHVQVDIGRSRVEVDPQARVRFDRVAPHDLRLTVVEGRIEAQFNPDHIENRSMAVETRSARVRVVGTRFSVAVDGPGNTTVEVTEGAVEVIPRRGPWRRLAAGQRTEVLYDPGDATEQAVRDALTEQLSAANSTGLSPIVSGALLRAEPPALAERRASPHPLSLARVPLSSPERRLDHARELLRKEQHNAARKRLRALARDDSVERRYRAEALTLIAKSYVAQGYVPRAADAYRAAAAMAPHHPVGHHAVFDLAQLLERRIHDVGGARAAYQQYLRRAPEGALASEAQQALCRLRTKHPCQKP